MKNQTCETCRHFIVNPTKKQKRLADTEKRAEKDKQGVCEVNFMWCAKENLRCGGDDYQRKI